MPSEKKVESRAVVDGPRRREIERPALAPNFSPH
jgi:hypothetical protein